MAPPSTVCAAGNFQKGHTARSCAGEDIIIPGIIEAPDEEDDTVLFLEHLIGGVVKKSKISSSSTATLVT
jgi:hypothetical protein